MKINWFKIPPTLPAWAEVLRRLLEVAEKVYESGDIKERRKVAKLLIEYIKHSPPGDISNRVDPTAKKVASAIIHSNIEEGFAGLFEASADFEMAVKEFKAATAEAEEVPDLTDVWEGKM